ncbi:hypothetical protein ACU8KH_02721 [Lachancea thermotolerans]
MILGLLAVPSEENSPKKVTHLALEEKFRDRSQIPKDLPF